MDLLMKLESDKTRQKFAKMLYPTKKKLDFLNKNYAMKNYQSQNTIIY